jgi:hypothetical protein
MDRGGFSDDFREHARSEADRLQLEAARLREEVASHEAAARALTAQALTVEQRLRELRGVLEDEPTRDVEPDAELRGQRVRDVAVEVLLRHRGANVPMHYRQWFGLLGQDGYRVAGRDPLATFLTQIRRSPVVQAVPNHAGQYVVDLEAATDAAIDGVRAAERRISEIRAATAAGQALKEEDLPRARRELERAERTLAEVARWQARVVSRSRPLTLVQSSARASG